MKLIPAISIKQGRVVMADDGAYRFLRNDEGQFRNPVNLVREMGFPAEEVFILDIDGLERNYPDLDVVRRIAAYKDVWLDAGAGDSESMMDLFVSDASRVVMGTLCMDRLDELGKALEISENVIFSLGWDGGVVSPDASIAGKGIDDVLRELEKYPGLRIGMLFDLGGLRDGAPLDMDSISRLAGRFEEFYVSGHITKDDLPALEKAGVAGAILDYRKLGEFSDG